MIIGIHGLPRSGKTLLAVLMLKIASLHNRKIISNISLKLKYEPMDLEKIVNLELSKCVCFLDEAYNYLDCRLSISKLNRVLSYFIFQSGKKDVDILYTAQLARSVDFRLADLANVKILANKITFSQTFANNPNPDDIECFDFLICPQLGDKSTFTLSGKNAQKIYPLFDSYENVMKV